MTSNDMSPCVVNQYISRERFSVNPKFKPFYHAVPPIGWINDPNGFSYFRGCYHLFGQYHPYSSKWGPMHWGHWTSTDLVRWEWAGVVLAPDTPADAGGCFSGSAQVDGDKLWLMYTGLSDSGSDMPYQQQCLAYSKDGYNFTKVDTNPVIGVKDLPNDASPYDFRDPCFRRANGKWMAIIANQCGQQGRLLLYSSDDLKCWQYQGVFWNGLPSMLECPDCYELNGQTMMSVCVMHMPLDGLKYPHTQPAVLVRGRLNESQTKFLPAESISLDNGWDFYAPQTLAAPDGRRLMVGWLQCWQHDMPSNYLNHGWNGCLSLVRELRWADGKLLQSPVREIETLRAELQSVQTTVTNTADILLQAETCAELLVTLSDIHAECVELRLFRADDEALLLQYHPATEILEFDASHCGYSVSNPPTELRQMQSRVSAPLHDGCLSLRVFLDACSAEFFVNNGESVISTRVFPKKHGRGVHLSVYQGDCGVRISLYKLAI